MFTYEYNIEQVYKYSYILHMHALSKCHYIQCSSNEQNLISDIFISRSIASDSLYMAYPDVIKVPTNNYAGKEQGERSKNEFLCCSSRKNWDWSLHCLF